MFESGIPGTILVHSDFRVAARRAACLTLLMAGASTALAGPLGMVSDNRSDRLSLFNADLDIITASMAAKPGNALGDCVIAADERTGVTTSSDGEITFLDFSKAGETSSVYDSGTETVHTSISNLGIDMAISPDDRFIVLSGGGALQQPLSVVSTETRTEIATAGYFADHTSVEFCDDGTLLVTTSHGATFGWNQDNAVYDARVNDSGEVSLLGNRLSSGAAPNNTACAPGSFAGVLLDREGGVTTFTLPEMNAVAHHEVDADMAVAAVFSADGRRLFIRTTHSLQSWDFNPLTAEMQLSWQEKMPPTTTYFGIDQIALHPNGSKLYVDGGHSMLIFDAHTGQHSGMIAQGDTTGICFANQAGPDVGAQHLVMRNPPVNLP